MPPERFAGSHGPSALLRTKIHSPFSREEKMILKRCVAAAVLLCLTPLLLAQGVAPSPAGAADPEFGRWAATPPMGWNSWDCFGPTVAEAEVRANAEYMATHLRPYGWEYIVVDIRWCVENDKAHGYNETDPVLAMDEYGRLQPAVNRFPSAAGGLGFKPLADYVHGLGLKFGIHIMRGIPKLAVERRTPVLGTARTAADISSTRQLCTWLRDMYTVEADSAGAQDYYNSLFALYVSWGIDFIKVDDIADPYHADEIAMIRKAIDGCGRPIVLSLSPGPTHPENAGHASAHANMWRLTADFWDNWTQLEEHFALFATWISHMRPGHWPDGDMLPLGRIGLRAERGDPRHSRFTPDETVTLLTLFCICRSPLMFGGHLPDTDPFTLALITNGEALSVLQKSRNNRLLFSEGGRIAWAADDAESGDTFVALFYTGADPGGANSAGAAATSGSGRLERAAGAAAGAAAGDSVRMQLPTARLGLMGKIRVRDLWAQQPLGTFHHVIPVDVRSHGARLLRVHPVR